MTSSQLIISKPPGKVDKHIKNCLGDCEQGEVQYDLHNYDKSSPFIAIAIIEQGLMKGDSTTAKIEALKLGYLCCAKLINNQRKREFEYRLKEFGIEMPANTDQIRNEVRYTCICYIRCHVMLDHIIAASTLSTWSAWQQ